MSARICRITHDEMNQVFKPELKDLLLAVLRAAKLIKDRLVIDTPDGLRWGSDPNLKSDLMRCVDELIRTMMAIRGLDETFTTREREVYDTVMTMANESVLEVFRVLADEVSHPVNNDTE